MSGNFYFGARYSGCCQAHRGFTCLISFSPVFYVLLSPYFCFFSFLYLDLYVLGDNSWISKDLSCKPNIYVSWSISELRVRLDL